MRMRALLCALALITSLVMMGCKDREVIVENLSQDDANEILVALWDHRIDATKEAHAQRKTTSYNISVKSKQAHQALRILVVNQLPKSKRAGLKEVYPLGSSGIIPTKSDEAARLTMALQGEIEALIKALPQVSDAHVVLSMDPASAKSASLTLSYRSDPDHDHAPYEESDLQSLVSFAIGGLEAKNVRVIMKALKPVKFISPQGPALHEPASIKNTTISPSLLWPLITLIALALITASYALLRPRIKIWLRG